jgi:hypothetical protein
MVMFDTLKFARHLEASGLAPTVAAGAAEALADALVGSNLVTKDDLRNEITGVRGEITGLRHEMELLRRDVTIKVGGMMVIAVGVLLAAIRYLPPHS